MESGMSRLFVLLVTALALCPAGCREAVRTPVDGDQDVVAEHDRYDNPASDLEDTPDQPGDIPETPDDTEARDRPDDDGQQPDMPYEPADRPEQDEQPPDNPCEPSPCREAHRSRCVEDAALPDGFACQCDQGYELVTWQSPGGEVTRCRLPETACEADRELLFTGDRSLDTATTTGAGNDFTLHYDPQHGCSAFKYLLEGPDTVYRFESLAGQATTVTVIPRTGESPSFDPALAVARGCGNREPCLACADSHGSGMAETLTFAPAGEGVYHLAVDSAWRPDDPRAAGAYDLVVERTFLEACLAGETLAFTDLPASRVLDIAADDGQDIAATCGTRRYDGPDTTLGLALNAGQQVELSATPSRGDLEVALLVLAPSCFVDGEAARCLMGAHQEGEGAPPRLVFTAPHDGVYGVVVEAVAGLGAGGAVTLEAAAFTPAPCQAPVVSLPFSFQGDTGGGANHLAAACDVGAGRGYDLLWAVDLPSGGTLRMDLSEVTAGAILLAMVLDEEGCVTNNPGPCLAFTYASTLFTATREGRYYVVVDSLDGTRGDFRLDLAMSETGPCQVWRSVNSLPFTAQDDTTGGLSQVGGFPPCVSDRFDGPDHVYQVRLSRGMTYRIFLESPGFDAALAVLDRCETGEGAPRACLAGSDIDFGGGGEEVWFTPPSTADYYVVVDSSRPQGAGAYVLGIDPL